MRQRFTKGADADGRGSSYTARSMTGTGMLVRGLPLRVLGRQMRHGRKGCGRTDKETRRQQETTQAREARCVCLSVLGCVYASVYPSCSRWLLAISSKNDHCCRLYSYKWRVFFFWVGMRVVLFLVCIKNSTISSKNDHCCILVQVACFFFLGWDLALFFFFIVRTYLVCVASSRVLYC